MSSTPGNSDMVALVSGREEKAEKVGEKYGITKHYSYDEMGSLLNTGGDRRGVSGDAELRPRAAGGCRRWRPVCICCLRSRWP